MIRPTSETVFGEYLSRWIQSYRDLPLRLNQWANVVRWELRPRLFLRTSEFLWQEGHTAHATRADAAAYARRIHTEVYRSALQDVLAIPVLTGLKTEAERFAGATATLTCEGMMRDGKALQLATSHELGQNFARAFDITYTDEHGTAQHCWTTSWGSSTRMIGGLIMAHGDDAGLRLPPRVAPVQVILVAVKDAPGVTETITRVERELGDLGIRVRADQRTDIGLGRRLTDWELKGVPVRMEVGPRDLANNQVTVVRRDDSQRAPRVMPTRPPRPPRPRSTPSRPPSMSRPSRCKLAAPWTSPTSPRRSTPRKRVSPVSHGRHAAGGRATLNAAGISIRCITTPEGTVPDTLDTEDLVAIAARAY